MNKKRVFLVLIVILLVIAVMQGINYIHTKQVEANRAGVIADIKKLGLEAQEYYKRASVTEGRYKFTGWQITGKLYSTENGVCSITVSEQQVKIDGTGTEIGNDEKTKVKIRGIITPTSITYIVDN